MKKIIIIIIILVVLGISFFLGYQFMKAKSKETVDKNMSGEQMLTSVKELYIDAKRTYTRESSKDNGVIYSRCEYDGCKSNINDNYKFYYYISIDKIGRVTRFFVTNDVYQYRYEGTGLYAEDIELEETRELNPTDIITIYPTM